MIDALYRFLVSLGYTDPIHSPVTHMPIGLIFGGLVFLIVAVVFKNKRLELSARHASILALVMVFPTVLFGILDWVHFYHGVLYTPILIKIILATSVTILLTVGIIFGNAVKLGNLLLTGVLALSFLATIGLGWFGAGIIAGRGMTTAMSAPEKAGEPLFISSCQSCHANGGNSIAPQLPLKGSVKLSDAGRFVAFIRVPKMPDGSEGAMPAFPKDRLDDSQAQSLYLYLKAVESSWK
jgi:mono/diheme cytochrome c family protein